MRYRKIPDESIRRLPIYLRSLLLLSEQGTQNISSRKLAHFTHLNPNKIRKDFSYFGAFGTPGVGYNVAGMIKQIRVILRLGTIRKAALVGVGKLGSALLGYPGFKMYGFKIAAVFDNDPKKIGKKIGNITIEDISRLRDIRKRKINLAIITAPAQSAQNIADMLVDKGVNGILNFAPCYLEVPKKVKVITIDIAMDLARMPYYLPTS
jgi:redox-sensing transcriptional repressor